MLSYVYDLKIEKSFNYFIKVWDGERYLTFLFRAIITFDRCDIKLLRYWYRFFN